MATFEDPYEQLFYSSMEVQLEVAKDTKVDAAVRVKASDELQRSYLTKLHAEQSHTEIRSVARTANKALDQIKRLKGDEE